MINSLPAEFAHGVLRVKPVWPIFCCYMIDRWETKHAQINKVCLLASKILQVNFKHDFIAIKVDLIQKQSSCLIAGKLHTINYSDKNLKFYNFRYWQHMKHARRKTPIPNNVVFPHTVVTHWLFGCLLSTLTCSMLGKFFSRRHFEIFFLFFPENRLKPGFNNSCKFSYGDNLHETPNPVFWENIGDNLHEILKPVFWQNKKIFSICHLLN